MNYHLQKDTALWSNFKTIKSA